MIIGMKKITIDIQLQSGKDFKMVDSYDPETNQAEIIFIDNKTGTEKVDLSTEDVKYLASFFKVLSKAFTVGHDNTCWDLKSGQRVE